MKIDRHLSLAGLLGVLCAGCYTTKSSSESSDELTVPPTTVPPPTVPSIEDRILQASHERIDLMFVVQDTAGSEDAREQAAESLPNLVDYFLGAGIDYHIGMISADTSDPATAGLLIELAGLRWIDADTPDPIASLMGMMTEGSGSVSAPRDAVYAALDALPGNEGFRRSDAALEIVVLSDGEDTSALGAGDLSSWLAGITPDGEAPWDCLLTGTGVACAETTALLGGTTGDAADSSVYGAIGLSSSGLSQRFALSALPDPDTLDLQVEVPEGATLAFERAEIGADGEILTEGDWLYEAETNEVRFLEFVPSHGSTIVVSYEPAP